MEQKKRALGRGLEQLFDTEVLDFNFDSRLCYIDVEMLEEVKQQNNIKGSIYADETGLFRMGIVIVASFLK